MQSFSTTALASILRLEADQEDVPLIARTLLKLSAERLEQLHHELEDCRELNKDTLAQLV